jgi:integrase
VSGLIASYVEKHVKTLRSSAAIERRFMKNVLPMIGAVTLAELHRRDINRVIDPILARDAPVEAARVFEDVRAALHWAVRRGDLDRNPAEAMRKPSARPPRERMLKDDEIACLWNGLPRALARSKHCQRIIKLCLVTAQRVGEVAGMRRDELDFGKRAWSLAGARTKNGFPHTVPLSDLALAIITEALADSGESPFLFPVGPSSEERPLPPAAVARTILHGAKISDRQPTARFGVAAWSAHDLRRTALTGMAALGIAPIVLGHIANHRTTTHAGITLAVYAKYGYDREKREALDLWAAKLSTVVAGTVAAAIQ